MKQLEIQQITHNQSGDIVFPKPVNSIDIDNWNYPADVNVTFGMAYDQDNIYLKYKVNEKHPKAVTTNTNGPVWEDSCVEFFIAFNDDEYYNLEFNCIGTKLAGLGTSNKDRQWLNEMLVESINTDSTLGTEPIDIEDAATEWEMNIIIPKTIFGNNVKGFLPGQVYKANFYKCGDKQKQMHFLSWNPIANESPNFHLPEFFGTIKLV